LQAEKSAIKQVAGLFSELWAWSGVNADESTILRQFYAPVRISSVSRSTSTWFVVRRIPSRVKFEYACW
jgi:hypothetical protein